MVRGNLTALSGSHLLAVVGTRKMSSYGRQALKQLIPPLVQAGVTIVSGLAYGVDACAHEIALKHGGSCVAVLGCGVDIAYPASHERLMEQILSSGGALVSEQPLGMKPRPQFFPARNRIISGLSQAVLIVEAQQRSGSLITAQFALEQNRDVYAVPGSIFSSCQRGTNELIAQGARPVLDAESFLSELGLSASIGASELPLLETEAEQRIFQALAEPLSRASLSERCALSVSELSVGLSRLELKGLIFRGRDQLYLRS